MANQTPVGLLTLVCAATGGEFNCGIIYCDFELSRARNAKILSHCRYCGETHLFKFSDARLSPLGSGLEQFGADFDA